MACADNLRKLARINWEIGFKQKSQQLADEAIKTAEGTDSYELAWSYAVRGQIAMTAFQFDLAAEVSKKAIEIAERYSFKDAESFALSTLGLCDWADVENAASILRRGLALGLEQNTPENVGCGYANVGVYLAEHFLYAEAVKVYDEGILYCNQQDLRAGSEFLSAGRFDVRERMGA